MDRPVPVVTHLSGTHRGKTQKIDAERMRVGAEAGAEVQLHSGDLPSDVQPDSGSELATVQWSGSGYELKASSEPGVYVNGRKVEYVILDSGDVVQIGPEGPALRFRTRQPDARPGKTIRQAMADCVDCARYTGKNWLHRALIILSGAPKELATQTTLWFRLIVSAALIVLVGFVGYLGYRNYRLEERLAGETFHGRRLQSLMSRAEQNTFTVDELTAARTELEGRLSETLQRVEALEARQTARERVIAAVAPSVVFLQGAYGFVEPGAGRTLRFIDPEGDPPPADSRVGPFFTFAGSGPEVEILYTGTAFIVSGTGDLLTNKHVAVPWDFDEDAEAVIALGLEPVMRRFIGFLPGVEEPFDVSLVRKSDRHDVALLRCAVPPSGVPSLPLTESTPRPGDEVIVMGYPTGIRALVARSGAEFIESLEADEEMDFWTVTRRLAAGGHIAPLATAGVVGQVTGSNIVYDAETTHGGSGGPVLDLEGNVVAVNAAILPEFGGSNLGVPAAEAVKLLR